MHFPIVSRTMVLTSFLLAIAYSPAMAETEVNVDAELKPCASPCVTEPGATGELEYEAEFLSNGVTIKEAELKAVVKIPVPNSFNISAINAGNPGLVTLDLTRLNQSYATCTMVLKKARPTSLTYVLKLSGQLKNGQFVFGKKLLGFCDVDLLTLDIQSGIPIIQDGDIAFVVVNGTTHILSALLENENDDDQGENEN